MTKRTKVLHVVPHLNSGGAERMAAQLMCEIDRSAFEVSALVLGERNGSPLHGMLEERGIRAFYLGKKAGFNWRMFGGVRRVLGEVRPDITHTHVHVLRYVLPELLLGRGGKPVHTVHNLAEWEVESRAQWLQRVAFRTVVRPISVAGEVSRSLERRYGVVGSPVIPNCIPVQEYRRPAAVRNEWRRREGMALDDVVFTSVALFRPQKNHARLLRAFAAGPGRDPRAKLLLVGGGPLEASIRQTVAALGMENNVRLLGIRNDVPEILAASDVFVLASDYEGNPLAVMEAMAAGLPVVSTSVGGVPELIKDGKDGLLFPATDEAGFQKGLLRLMNEGSTRAGMGAAARQSAEQQFDLPIMVRAYEALYDSVERSTSRRTEVLAPTT